MLPKQIFLPQVAALFQEEFNFTTPPHSVHDSVNGLLDYWGTVNGNNDLLGQATRIEGLVVADSQGLMVKMKTDYYQQWKYIRTAITESVKNGEWAKSLHPQLSSEGKTVWDLIKNTWTVTEVKDTFYTPNIMGHYGVNMLTLRNYLVAQ